MKLRVEPMRIIIKVLLKCETNCLDLYLNLLDNIQKFNINVNTKCI